MGGGKAPGYGLPGIVACGKQMDYTSGLSLSVSGFRVSHLGIADGQ